MNEVSLKPVIEELESLFSKFNARFFADKLEKPVITVSPDHTRGAYSTLKSVIKLADKFNVDRDNAIQHFATLIHTMSQIATFQHWEGVDP